MSVLIIAEAGVNHNGSLELAKKMGLEKLRKIGIIKGIVRSLSIGRSDSGGCYDL